MGYKYVSDKATYTCGRCVEVIATHMDAVAMRETERDTGVPYICEKCAEEEDRDLDHNDYKYDRYVDRRLEDGNN